MNSDNQTHDLSELPPRPLSRLSYLIMGLNLIALGVLVGGIFYLDQFKRDLTNAETQILATEAQLYAADISDKAFMDGRLDKAAANFMMKNLIGQKTQRLRLFAKNGTLIADTKTDDRVPVPASQEIVPGFFGRALEWGFSQLVNLFSVTFKLPAYPQTSDLDISSFPDAPDALEGDLSLSAWQAIDGGLILSTAVPVKKDNAIMGALLVTRGDTEIERIFSTMRIDIIRFSLGALLVTLTFSLYLSSLIGHPLRQLASAAQAIREGRAGVHIIPDMSARNDEIGELSIALREMAEALQERINSIERFAADVSHELKNPLTSMRSAVETLDKVTREEDRHKLRSIILHDLHRMDRLISDISHASRLDVELLREVLSPVDLRGVILPLIDAYRKPLERKQSTPLMPHNIECTGLERKIEVLGHGVRLSQVFQNLLENALSFSPPDQPVMIRVARVKNQVEVVVEDSGPGIPHNRLDKIFERFYSERPQTEAFGSHSGLGLSIARQIMDSHDGSLSAQNRVDETGKILGARFIVRLNAA